MNCVAHTHKKKKKSKWFCIWQTVYFRLPCVNSSADDWAALQYEPFFKYISFSVVKSSVVCSVLRSWLCSRVWLLCVSWQRCRGWKHFSSLGRLSGSFLCIFPTAVGGHILSGHLSMKASVINAQVCLWMRESEMHASTVCQEILCVCVCLDNVRAGVTKRQICIWSLHCVCTANCWIHAAVCHVRSSNR